MTTALPAAHVGVSGSGFTPGAPLELFFDRADLASATADTNGNLATVTLTVPVDAPYGTHWVTALDPSSVAGAQATVTVQSGWPMSSDVATHIGFNAYENALTPTVVSGLPALSSGRTAHAPSSPIVVGNVSYMGAANGVLYAMRSCQQAGGCHVRWKGAVGGKSLTTPAAAAGVVYVGSSNGSVDAFSTTCGTDAATCSPRWSGSTGGAAVTSPVTVNGGVVYVGAADGSLLAFSASGCGDPTCAPLWRSSTGSAILAAPTVAGDVVDVGSTDGSEYGFSTTTGAQVWTGPTGGPIVATAAVFGKTVYVGSEDGSLYAFPGNCSGTCSPAWHASVGAPIEASPAIAYNSVFVGADNGSIHAWSTRPCATPPCSPSWTAQMTAPITGSLAVADSVLYAASSSGSLAAYTARGLHPLTTLAVSAGALTAPAVTDNAVYVGSADGTLHVYGYAATAGAAPPLPTLAPLPTPIRHVVVLFQENNSFDEVLGKLCVSDARCDGAMTGKTSDGQTVPLTPEPDILPVVDHSVEGQTAAIDGGKMDGFNLIKGCTAADGYACYSQIAPGQIPNLAALARSFVISDRTFEESDSPSYGGHIDVAAAQLDGFQGDAPGVSGGGGWGCDSNLSAPWIDPATQALLREPSCIPRPDGSGPFAPSPVAFAPTIMDRLDAAGYPWRIYTADFGFSHAGYAWAVCPMFANCLYSADAKGMTSAQQVMSDAGADALPTFSLVIPDPANSQHNSDSITQGDDWIGSVVSAIESSPDWQSTAIFITYDDCGCFYDHVAPPPGLGIRVPMVIVSPYARPASTDSNVASFASVLAFTEHAFGVPSLGADDSTAYDYNQSFNYAQAPLRPVQMVKRPVPPASLHYMKTHPPSPDDPT